MHLQDTQRRMRYPGDNYVANETEVSFHICCKDKAVGEGVVQLRCTCQAAHSSTPKCVAQVYYCPLGVTRFSDRSMGPFWPNAALQVRGPLIGGPAAFQSTISEANQRVLEDLLQCL